MTPRQISAYMFLGERRRERELHEFIAASALATQGGSDLIKKQLNDLEKDQ